ncbi:MAG: SsrA-binding protein SmpB [Polyangiaceae bacterium]|nr:SsrA-binding protein SmpB [Polyangiaceae bacterium]
MARSTATPTNQGDRLVGKNRRAQFEYELGERHEAGLVLIGSEARSLRINAPGLSDAWVDIDSRGQAWVKGLRIPVLKHAAFGHDETRMRKLLLHAEEIEQLRSAIERQGMTLVVTKVYFKHNRAKIELAVARGRKKHDKRQLLRERDAAREAQQAMRRAKTG